MGSKDGAHRWRGSANARQKPRGALPAHRSAACLKRARRNGPARWPHTSRSWRRCRPSSLVRYCGAVAAMWSPVALTELWSCCGGSGRRGLLLHRRPARRVRGLGHPLLPPILQVRCTHISTPAMGLPLTALALPSPRVPTANRSRTRSPRSCTGPTTSTSFAGASPQAATSTSWCWTTTTGRTTRSSTRARSSAPRSSTPTSSCPTYGWSAG